MTSAQPHSSSDARAPGAHAQLEQHPSAWLAHTSLPERPPLASDLQAEICVIGAGISGLTTAMLLAQSGHSVVVLDGKPIAAGQTHRTSAHLSCVIDDHFSRIERVHGERGSRLAAQSHRAAIDLIESLCASQDIDCDFQRVDAFLFRGDGDTSDLLARERAAALRAGVHAEALHLSLGAGGTEALRFPQQAQFDPMRYVGGLAEAAERLGVRIFCGTHVTQVQGGRDAQVRTEPGYVVRAASIVVATNTPVNDRAVMHTKLAPYTTYVIGLEIHDGVVPPGLYWDTLDPYHYVRSARFGTGDAARTVLLVGGEDHKTGQAEDKAVRFVRLAEWAERVFRVRGEVRHTWSGQVMETLDGLAFIGRNPMDHDNVHIITGDSGMGLTHGTLGAMIVSDLITGTHNPWADLYDPSRKPIATLRTFASENLNVAQQMGDWITPGQVGTRGEIAPGCGAIVRNGIHKEAVFRDEDGTEHRCSAVCPHLGCIVRWNGVEKIWDCPCHGSRFDRYGKVLTGPSRADLAPLGAR